MKRVYIIEWRGGVRWSERKGEEIRERVCVCGGGGGGGYKLFGRSRGILLLGALCTGR